MAEKYLFNIAVRNKDCGNLLKKKYHPNNTIQLKEN